MTLNKYKFNPGLDTDLIPVQDHEIDDYINSTFGKAYEQWLSDRFDITVQDLIESNDQSMVNRLQGALRELLTMQEFPDFLLQENKMKREEDAMERLKNK